MSEYDADERNQMVQDNMDRHHVMDEVRTILLQSFNVDTRLTVDLIEYALNVHIVESTRSFWEHWDCDANFEKDYNDFTIPLIMQRNLKRLLWINELFRATTYTRDTNFFVGGREHANERYQLVYTFVLFMTAQAILKHWVPED